MLVNIDIAKNPAASGTTDTQVKPQSKFKMRGDVTMQGNPKLIETLNALLADELAAINQYIVHAEMCEDWGYGKLHEGWRSGQLTR